MCPQRCSAKCQQAHKNSLGLKLRSSSLFCPSCAKGKMKSQSFPESQSCATRLFELIHLDLKSLPVESYHRFKYFIVVIDDKSSHMWTANLRKKSDASKAIKNFEAMARIQHGANHQKMANQSRGGVYQLRSHGYPEGSRLL